MATRPTPEEEQAFEDMRRAMIQQSLAICPNTRKKRKSTRSSATELEHTAASTDPLVPGSHSETPLVSAVEY